MKTKDEQMNKAEELFKEIFAGPRDPRSDEYKRGVMAALLFRFAGVRVSENRPYKVGTVEFDAFSAGVDEGNARWREHMSPEAKHRRIIEQHPASEPCSCDPVYERWCAFHAEFDKIVEG